jgi:hypothetical protein
MPQQASCSTPRAKAKTSKVQKLLKNDNLRQSAELSWQREKRTTEPLELLARCKALNEFIKKVCILHIL